jgi:hypothetical protein
VTKDEFADYLPQYAAEGGYRIVAGTQITACGTERLSVRSPRRRWRDLAAGAVIVAKGGHNGEV